MPSCRRPIVPYFSALVLLAGLMACAQAPVGRPADANQADLAAALRSQPLVLLGEVHDNAAQQALRAAVLRGFIASGARPALLMEQFDRERQADLDRAVAAPGATAQSVIAAAAPADAGWNWDFYRPFVALALEYRLPLVAANVSRADTRRAIQSGLAALGFDAAVPSDIEAAQADEIVQGHCGALELPQARRMVAAQEARDQFMARLLAERAARGAVLLAGNGHVRRDIGVPRWLAPDVRGRSVSIGLLEADTLVPGAFDVSFESPAQPRGDPCEGFKAPSMPGRAAAPRPVG